MGQNEELEKKVAEVEQADIHSGKEKKRKSAIKSVTYLVLVLAVTAFSIVITMSKGFDEIVKQLFSCDWRWLLAILGIMFGVVCIRSFILFCFARLYTRKYKVHQAIAVDQIGQFYNAVTPGASGGQVMQAYTYKKQGIPISSAVSMLAMHSIIFQIVLIIYGTISFIVKYDAINSIGTIPFRIADWSFAIPIWPLTIVGFILNVSVIAIVLLMGYWKGFHNFIMGPVITFLANVHLIKNPDRKRENLRVQVENFKIEMRRLFTNIPFTVLVTVFFFLYFTIRYSVPYFVGCALGNESTMANFWDSVFLSNYHQMVTGLIPIPGAAGVSEYFFARLFAANGATAENSFYFVRASAEQIMNVYTSGSMTMQEAVSIANSKASSSLANAALLIWRTVTFILPLTVAGFVTAFYRASPKGEVETVPNRDTFVELQRQTMVERSQNMQTMVETSRLRREEIINMLKKTGQRKKKKKKIPRPHHKNSFDDVNIDHEDDAL